MYICLYCRVLQLVVINNFSKYFLSRYYLTKVLKWLFYFFFLDTGKYENTPVIESSAGVKKRRGRGCSVNIVPIADYDVGENYYSSSWSGLDDKRYLHQTTSNDSTFSFKSASYQDSSTLTMDSVNRNIVIDYKEPQNSCLEEVNNPETYGMYENV